MDLITREQYALLLQNGAAKQADPHVDLKPLLKIHANNHQNTWFIAGVYPDDGDMLFGVNVVGRIIKEATTSIEHLVHEGYQQEKDWVSNMTLGQLLLSSK